MAGRREVRRHLRMANGFITTVEIREDSTEFEIRNALSRSYYALFHVSHAWLAMNNVPLSRRKQHESLIREIRDKRGKECGDRLERFWLLRKRADYDEPEFFEASAFQGELDKFRLSAREHLSLMEREFESYISEMEGFLEPR
jgi:uncharacterized protein (UPF0332 family)